MTRTMEIVFAGRTHVGLRVNNEDAFLADRQLGLFLVADGLGGYEGGEVASKLAVETIRGFVSSDHRDDSDTWPIRHRPSSSYEENLLDAAMVAAHQCIVARREGPVIEMGSTVVASLIAGREMVVAHVGDSRLYRLRDGELTVLTRDHTLWEELKGRGISNRLRPPFRNQLTRALGVERASDADVARHEMALGDTYLLCSDGLYEPLDVSDLRTGLRLGPGEGCEYLISRSLEKGGADNLTGVIIRVTWPW